ncbi:MAG: hypothetical protein JNL88_01620 [Bacteroidia bacterium]|nr:hypothetical protein [Bacteroidia bacterium]
MKKLLLSLIFSLVILAPLALQAQTDAVAKGKRGGYLVTSAEQNSVSFEIVDNGSEVKIFPCGPNGEMLSVVPTEAEITVVYLSTTIQHHEKEVQLTNGAFTINPPREYPIYMYGIRYIFNDQEFSVKYRIPGSPQPR